MSAFAMATLADTEAPALRVCVGVATRGRPADILHLISRLRRQTLKPATIIVACVEPADVAGLNAETDIRIVYCAPGLTRQRNGVLDLAPPGTDIMVFFDDDFIPDDRWLEAVAAYMVEHPAVAAVTGHVVADGILGAGLTYAEGEAALASAERSNFDWRVEGYSPYGCNMAFRATAIAGLRFDEKLVLYGWLEDRDFGARVAAAGGGLVKLGAAFGVHLGAKRGRVSGKRLGYSQIVNPAYMHAKGTITARVAATTAVRNICANLAKSFRPEAYIDRRGRLLGNALGLIDLLKGVNAPERAESL